LIYQGIEYKKHQRVKFVIPTDERIIDPHTYRKAAKVMHYRELFGDDIGS